MDSWDEEEDGGSRSGRRARWAGVVLIVVFLGAPVLSTVVAVTGGGASGFGPILLALAVLAIIAGLYLVVVRVLRRRVDVPRDDEVWW